MEPLFRQLARIVVHNPGHAGMQAIVEKELLHYELLNILERGRWLDGLVFQGGTALRLCHSAERFIEDLHFSRGRDFSPERLNGLATALEKGLAASGLVAGVRPPRNSSLQHLEGDVNVSTWHIDIVTQPDRRNVPEQRIKIDIDNAPVHARELRKISRNYDVLPSLGMLVHVQSREEILANKLVAFPTSVATWNRPRYRDVWDMHWLSENGTKVRADLLSAKIAEQGACRPWLENAAAKSSEIVRSAGFAREMRRFLPPETARRTLDNPEYVDVLALDTERLIRTAADCLSPAEPPKQTGAARKPDAAEAEVDDRFAVPDPFKLPSPFD